MWISNMNVPDLRKQKKPKRLILVITFFLFRNIDMALMNIYGKTAVFLVVRYGKINHESRSSDEGIEAPRVSSSFCRYTQIMPIPPESQADYWQPTGILDGRKIWFHAVGMNSFAQLPF